MCWVMLSLLDIGITLLGAVQCTGYCSVCWDMVCELGDAKGAGWCSLFSVMGMFSVLGDAQCGGCF